MLLNEHSYLLMTAGECLLGKFECPQIFIDSAVCQ